MHTKILMSLSALFLAILGVGASFLPQEILGHFGVQGSPFAVLLVQVAGALYLGFAILNWMARAILIGGIYARPVALGNFLHFGVVAVTLTKMVAGGTVRASDLVAGCVLYAIFAIWFAVVLFTSPVQKQA